MASDNLNEVGKYIRHSGRSANLALKRYTKNMPKHDRARDTISSIHPFVMQIDSDGKSNFTLDINFNKPPPTDCEAECIATACEDFSLFAGGHSITVANPYEPGTIRVYTNGEDLETVQFNEENPSGGQVYVQVADSLETIVVCYSYVAC